MEVDKQRIAELVGKVQNGDNSAFAELYKLTSERAYFVALEFTKNNQDAEDILQESYIKALSKINELDKPESFSSWLNQIVANKSKDFLKKKKPMLFEAEEHEVFEVIPDEDTAFIPEDSLDQTELQKTVMEVLDELSEEKRACVLMMYFEELSVGEIAETLEIPEGTVKTRLFSARKDLKEKFAKRGITSTFSFAPMGVVIWALRNTSEAVRKTFAASPASARVLAGISVAGSGTAAAGVAAAGGTAAATTGTGIAAKIAALTVTQKIIAGVSVAAVVTGSTAGVVTVVNNDSKKDDISTTAYTEEHTTSPSFETTLAVEALGTVGFSETVFESKSADVFSSKHSTTGIQDTSAVKVTAESKTATQTAKKSTTTKKQTTTAKSATTKATTTKKPTTTKAVITTGKQTTTKKETTTKRVTTTEPTTTEKQTATTTTKPTATTTKATTTTTTEATTKGIATILIDVIDLNGDVVETLSFSVDAGTEMSGTYLWDLVESEGYSISGVFGSDKGSVAESGETYTFEAEI